MIGSLFTIVLTVKIQMIFPNGEILWENLYMRKA